MNGYIHELWKYKGYDCGSIIGEDKKEYYFDNRSLTRDSIMSDFLVGDYVQFEIKNNLSGGRCKVHNILLLKAVDSEDNHTPNQYGQDIVKFYRTGYARGRNGMNLKVEMGQHLKPDSQENIIIDKFSRIFYVTRVEHHSFRQAAFPYCLLGATSKTKQFIRGKYEFLMIFSHFDNEDWQQITLKAEREDSKKERCCRKKAISKFLYID